MAETKMAQTEPEQLQGEYVTGGNSWLYNDRLYLDQYSDDVPGLTPAVRNKISRDSEYKSSLNLLADSVFSEGIEVLPAVNDEKNSEYEEAKEIAEFVAMACSDIARPLESVLREMFKEAFTRRTKVAESVFKTVDDKLILDRLNPKPNSSVAFVCDNFFNVLGIAPINQIQKSENGDFTVNRDEIIRRDKFVVLAFELEDNDPRGLDELEGIYDEWCRKQETLKHKDLFQKTSAVPKKYVITSPGAKPTPVRDSEGKPIIENGRPKEISAEKKAIEAMEGFANNSSFAAPHGTTVGQLEVNGEGKHFFDSLKYHNSQLRKVIIGDAQISSEADKDSRASKESGKDVADIRKQTLRRTVSATVKKDLFRVLVVQNFGEDKAHLTPDCFLGDTEANDWATDVTAASRIGYKIAPEHQPMLDVRFGLEARKNNEMVEPVQQQSQQKDGNNNE